jgi:hypothetical protein
MSFFSETEINAVNLLAKRINKNCKWWADYISNEKAFRCNICGGYSYWDADRDGYSDKRLYIHGMSHIKEYNLMALI